MKLLPALPKDDDEVRVFEEVKMFGHGLPGHLEMPAQVAQRLAITVVQFIEQPAPAWVSQCLENVIHERIMQPNGCISKRILGRGEIPWCTNTPSGCPAAYFFKYSVRVPKSMIP